MSIDSVWKTVAPAGGKPAVRPMLMRLWNAIVEAQRRHDEREVVRYLASKAPLSDPIEREILRCLSGPPWTR
jgi:hypothetical protein